MFFHVLLQETPIKETTPFHKDLITALLVLLIILACVLCLSLMFRYVNRVQAEGLQQQKVIESLARVREGELYYRIEPIIIERNTLQEDKSNLEREVREEHTDNEERELRLRLYQIEEKLGHLLTEIQETEAEIVEEARSYAEEQVPSYLNWSNEFGPYFYLEFGTVIVTIFALLILAINETVTGQEAVPILAAIVGYVLGKATASSSAKSG